MWYLWCAAYENIQKKRKIIVCVLHIPRTQRNKEWEKEREEEEGGKCIFAYNNNNNDNKNHIVLYFSIMHINIFFIYPFVYEMYIRIYSFNR